MKLQPFMRFAATLTLLYAGAAFHSRNASAQEIDFGQIDSFESVGTGTRRGGLPPKTIVDEDERHTVFFTILESDIDVKIYWRSLGGDRTTLIHGPAVKAFQTAGEFRVEALGDGNHSFKYGYVLISSKK